MTSDQHVPMYHLVPTNQQPPPAETGWAEQFIVQKINTGYAMLHAFRDFQTARYPPLLELDVPHPDEAETYFDAIANILQVADHAGMEVALLCLRAIEQQRGFKRERQAEANQSGGRGILPAAGSVQNQTAAPVRRLSLALHEKKPSVTSVRDVPLHDHLLRDHFLPGQQPPRASVAAQDERRGCEPAHRRASQ